MNFIIRKADPDKDEGHILSLWKGNLPESTSERYRAIYSDNKYSLSRAWLAYIENDNLLIGTNGLCQRRMIVDGKSVTAGIPMDFVIHEKHRGFGPALKLQRVLESDCQNEGVDFIYVFPNKQAESIFKRIRYKMVGTMPRWVKVLKSSYKIKEKLKSGFLSNAVSKVIDPVITKNMKERIYRRPDGINVEVIDSFDKRFDVLWEKAHGRFKIIGDRTTAFLNWRYARFLKDNTRIYCLLDNEETLLGYIIYLVKDNIAYIKDLFFLDQDVHVDMLFAEYISYMRKEGLFAISISYFGNSSFINKLEAWMFIQREDNRNIMINVNDKSLSPILLDKENWHLFEVDDI